MNYFTANDQEKQVKCNLIFPQGAKVEKRTATKSFLKARPKAEPSECLRAGLFSTEAPWGMIKLHETGFSVSFQLKNNSNRMFFRIYWTFLRILKWIWRLFNTFFCKFLCTFYFMIKISRSSPENSWPEASCFPIIWFFTSVLIKFEWEKMHI